MDTDGGYIKMCDCSEVQEQWKLEYGDWVGVWAYDMNMREDFVGNHHIIMGHSNPNFVYALNDLSIEKDKCLWLPRQDQVQGMMPDGESWITMPRKYTKRLAEFVDSDNYNMMAKSMEQLWLCFYMFKCHEKVWDGEKWVAGE